MNKVVAECDGFRNCDNTFYYADTYSLLIPHRVVEELMKKHPDWFGKILGQLHDDIDEVIDGIIIGAIFLAPKLYILEILGIDKKTGLYTIPYHVRAKGFWGSATKLLLKTLRIC